MRFSNRPRPDKRALAEEMRQHPSPPEARMWQMLRCQCRVHGYRFRRQAIILGWIVDFWQPRLDLVVEVDGQTYHRPRSEQDAIRDARMSAEGILVLRITARQVMEDPRGALFRVQDAIRRRHDCQGHGPREVSPSGFTDCWVSERAAAACPWAKKERAQLRKVDVIELLGRYESPDGFQNWWMLNDLDPDWLYGLDWRRDA